jgi:hypothetical protein
MVPQYRLPQGFSSSYHRYLYGMEPVVIGGIPEDQIPLNRAPGVFFPEKVELSEPPAEARAAERSSTKVARVTIPPPQVQKKTAPNR